VPSTSRRRYSAASTLSNVPVVDRNASRNTPPQRQACRKAGSEAVLTRQSKGRFPATADAPHDDPGRCTPTAATTATLRARISIRSVHVEPLSQDPSPSRMKDRSMISTNLQRFSKPLWSSPICTIPAPTARPIGWVSIGRLGSNQGNVPCVDGGVIPAEGRAAGVPSFCRPVAAEPSRRIDPHVLNCLAIENPAEMQFPCGAADGAVSVMEINIQHPRPNKLPV